MRCPLALQSSANDLNALAIATDFLLIGGLTTAAVGVLLTFVLHDRAIPTPSAACTSDGCLFSLQGTF
jgi:hypothetical protein